MQLVYGRYRVDISSVGDRLPDGTAVYRFFCYVRRPGNSGCFDQLPNSSHATLIPAGIWLQGRSGREQRRLLVSAADRVIEILQDCTAGQMPYGYEEQLALLAHMSPDTFVGELLQDKYFDDCNVELTDEQSGWDHEMSEVREELSVC